MIFLCSYVRNPNIGGTPDKIDEKLRLLNIVDVFSRRGRGSKSDM